MRPAASTRKPSGSRSSADRLLYTSSCRDWRKLSIGLTQLCPQMHPTEYRTLSEVDAPDWCQMRPSHENMSPASHTMGRVFASCTLCAPLLGSETSSGGGPK